MSKKGKHSTELDRACFMLERLASKHFTKTSSYPFGTGCRLDLFYNQGTLHALGALETDRKMSIRRTDFPLLRNPHQARVDLKAIGCKELEEPHQWGRWTHLHFGCSRDVDKGRVLKTLSEYTDPFTGDHEDG